MAKFPPVQRINPEDFPEELRESMSILASTLNFFMEETYRLFTGEIDFENLKQQIVELDVKVDSTGTPTPSVNFRSDFNVIRGSYVIKYENLTNTTLVPTAQPFITYSLINSGVFKLNKVYGLQANNNYKITVLLIG